MCTDVFFFPIDTVKTRLQAHGGFFHNGGYRGIYKGIGSCFVASAPGAALFFVTYDGLKRRLAASELSTPVQHMVSASVGEIAACTVRVPSEVVKQRTQTGAVSSLGNLQHVLQKEGLRGLYRGWSSTIMREIPFTVIQFPLYEIFRQRLRPKIGDSAAGAVGGSVAGGVAAAATTPLDVIKTRIMLSKEKTGVREVVGQIAAEGYGAFFRGIGPRVMWISAGGAIFLGCYGVVSNALSEQQP